MVLAAESGPTFRAAGELSSANGNLAMNVGRKTQSQRAVPRLNVLLGGECARVSESALTPLPLSGSGFLFGRRAHAHRVSY